MRHDARRLLGLTAVALLVAAALPALDLRDVITDYTLASWGQKDGLPRGSVSAVAQDAEGFLWVGSDGGLLRFDGVRFIPAATLFSQEFLNRPVRAIHVSTDGSLWVGFADETGIIRITASAVERCRTGTDRSTGPAYFFMEDSQGVVWAGTHRGLLQWSGELWARDDGGLPPEAVYTGYVDAAGRLIVGQANALFRRTTPGARFERIEVSDRPALAYEVPRSLIEDDDSRVLATDPIEGFRLVGGQSHERPRQRGRGRVFLRDSRRTLWLGTIGQGLWRLKLETRHGLYSIERLNTFTGLLSDGVLSLFEDRDGNIWVGTTEGLNRLTPRKVAQITEVGLVAAVETTREGTVWLGTYDELIPFPRAGLSPGRRISLGNHRLMAMHADPSGSLWVATEDAVSLVAEGRLHLLLRLGGHAPHEVDSISSDGSRGLWLHDPALGYFHWTRTRLDRVPLPETFQRMRLMAAATSRDGRLWSAFSDGPLTSIDPPANLQMRTPAEGVTAGPFRAIYEDTTGALWFAGARGLTRFSQGRFESVPRGPGFPFDLTAIVGDGTDSLFLGTGAGIVRIARAAFDDALRTGAASYQLLDRSDGLAGLPRTYSTLRRAVRAADGRIWFVTARGVTVIDPAAFAQPPTPAAVKVEDIVAGGRRFPAASRIVLPPRTARLEIEYNALDLTAPHRMAFRYRLEGFDADWVSAGSKRQAVYTNLPPRQYRFRVLASHDDGVWREGAAPLDFSIRPSFYQSKWIYVATAVALALGTWLAWRLRLRHVRHEFALLLGERARLGREIHDTLLQSLVGVALHIDEIEHEGSLSREATTAQLTRLRKQVEHYIREARQSIFNLRTPDVDTTELIGLLHDASAEAVPPGAMHFQFTHSGTPLHCSPRVSRELLRIAREAVTNAVRHSGGSSLHMHVECTPHSIALRVADNGRGFESSEQAGNHYGLTGMTERAHDIGGSCEVVSERDVGTLVQVSVPIR